MTDPGANLGCESCASCRYPVPLRDIAMLRARLSSLCFAFTSLLMFASCDTGTGPGETQATLAVSAAVSGTSVVVVVVQVTATDIPTPLAFNIPVTSGVASGTITL